MIGHASNDTRGKQGFDMKEIKTRNTRIADLCSANGKNQNNSKRLTQKQRSNNPVHGWLRHSTMKHLHLVPLWWNHNFLTCVKMSPEFNSLRFKALFKLERRLIDISEIEKMKIQFQRLDSKQHFQLRIADQSTY